MEDSKLDNAVKAALHTYNTALLAYEKLEKADYPKEWKVFYVELTRFAMGNQGNPENLRHQMVFEKAHSGIVRRMPPDLVKAALRLAKFKGVTATKLVLPKDFRKIPDWLEHFTDLKNLEIGSGFNESYISLQHLPNLTRLRVGENPVALVEIDVPVHCEVICDGYEQVKETESPLDKFGRLLRVVEYTGTHGDQFASEKIYRATQETTAAVFNVVPRGQDPGLFLNSKGICGIITQIWLEERRAYRKSKESYLAWRNWGVKIPEKYASAGGNKFKFVYQKLGFEQSIEQFGLLSHTRVPVFGVAPSYIFRLSNIGEFLAAVFEKMILDKKEFCHMYLSSLDHAMGLEFDMRDQRTFKVVYFDPNKANRHSASRAHSLKEVRAWHAIQFTGNFLKPLIEYAVKSESQHFSSKDPVFIAMDLEWSLFDRLSKSILDPNIHYVKMPGTTLGPEGLFSFLDFAPLISNAWKHQVLRSLDALKAESLEMKLDLIESRFALEKEDLTTLRRGGPWILPQYIEVMQTLRLSAWQIAERVAEGLLHRSVRPQHPMHALMLQSSVKWGMLLFYHPIKIFVRAVKLLKLPEFEIVKLFCPEYTSLPMPNDSTHKQRLSTLCFALTTNAATEFFEGLGVLRESGVVGDAGMDKILEYHFPSKEMWDIACEHALRLNVKKSIVWFPLQLNELHLSPKPLRKILNIIGIPNAPSKEEDGPLIEHAEFIEKWADWLIALSGKWSQTRTERLSLLAKALAGADNNAALEAALAQLIKQGRYPIVVGILTTVAVKLSLQSSTSSDIFQLTDRLREIYSILLEVVSNSFDPFQRDLRLEFFDALCNLTARKIIRPEMLMKIVNVEVKLFAFDSDVNEALKSLKIPLQLGKDGLLKPLH